MQTRSALQIVMVSFTLAAPIRAQQYVRLGFERDDYVRYLELAGKLQEHPLLFRSPSLLAALRPAGPRAAHHLQLPLPSHRQRRRALGRPRRLRRPERRRPPHLGAGDRGARPHRLLHREPGL